MRRHPKLLTKAIGGIGLAIAFNREIASAVKSFNQGTFLSNPQAALADLAYQSVGVTGNTVDVGALSASITSKVGGYAFIKIAKWLKKHSGM